MPTQQGAISPFSISSKRLHLLDCLLVLLSLDISFVQAQCSFLLNLFWYPRSLVLRYRPTGGFQICCPVNVCSISHIFNMSYSCTLGNNKPSFPDWEIQYLRASTTLPCHDHLEMHSHLRTFSLWSLANLRPAHLLILLPSRPCSRIDYVLLLLRVKPYISWQVFHHSL